MDALQLVYALSVLVLIGIAGTHALHPHLSMGVLGTAASGILAAVALAGIDSDQPEWVVGLAAGAAVVAAVRVIRRRRSDA